MISTRPEKSVGSDGIWEAAESALRGSLDELGWDYGLDEGGGRREAEAVDTPTGRDVVEGIQD